MLTILLKFDDKLLKTVETDKDVVTIGRNEANDIQIDNLSVSKHHAKIFKQDDKYIIEDLKSTNGTYLNEKIISRVELHDKELITIGKHTLEINLNRKAATGGKNIINDTMLLKTEKHKQMLKKQQSS
jgi:pSer/pThr/pTyr-binding forkhead associated (FHA) protein